jgi:mersacidin/lichenicidin family type 2 lantibiotic
MMSTFHIIRAWKDPDYRRGLTDEQRAQLPPHPAGAIEFQEHFAGLLTLSPKGKSPCHKCGSG